MKAKENKKYFAHRSKIPNIHFSFIGLFTFLYRSLVEKDDIRLWLYYLLFFVAIDVVIFIVKFYIGRYSTVSFNEDGFTYRKYFKKEFVSWTNVYGIDEVSRFYRDTQYYFIKSEIDGEDKDYYVEKSLEIRELIEKYYFKDSGAEKTLKLPFYRKQNSAFLSNIIGFLFIALFVLLVIWKKDIIQTVTFVWLESISAILIGLVILIYFSINKDKRYKVNDQGVSFTLDERHYFLKWEDALRVYHKLEIFDSTENDILILNLDKEIAGKYDMVEIPVSSKFYKKLKENMKIENM